MSVTKINTVQAKNQFNALLNGVLASKEPVIVEKRGEPVAVLIDYETYQEKIQQKAKQETSEHNKKLIKEFEAYWKRMKEKHPKGTGPTGLEILHEMREERMKKFE